MLIAFCQGSEKHSARITNEISAGREQWMTRVAWNEAEFATNLRSCNFWRYRSCVQRMETFG